MTITKLHELILTRLYDFAKAHGYGEMCKLDDLAAEFGETDRAKVYLIAKDLERCGCITPDYTMDGTYAFITSEGARIVEQGGTTGVISAFRRDPGRFVVSVAQSTHFHGSVSGSNVAVHSQRVSQSMSLPRDLVEIFDRINDTLAQDLSLAEAQRRELLADVRTLRDELQREKPRGGVIREILGTLADVSSVAGLVIQVQPYIPSILS
jgi:hypothetical protein